MGARTALAAAAVFLLWAGTARAQGNYASTPTGGRSALMGNTGVALARDGSAPFNNPATIVRIDDTALAFSVNFYDYAAAWYSGWHQPGRVDPQFGALALGDTSRTESRADVIPSTLCLFFTVAGWGDTRDDPELLPNAPSIRRKGRQKLAACLGNVERQEISLPAIVFRGASGATVVNQAQSVTHSWTRFRAGPTYSAYLDDRLAVGVSLHGIYTTYGEQWSSSSVTIDPAGRAIATDLGAAADGSSLDLAAIFGLTYRVDPGVFFGASVEPPSLHVTSTYDAYLHNGVTSGVAGSDHVFLGTGHGDFTAKTPLRVAVGLGAEWRRLRIEVNEALYAPIADALRADLHVDTVTVDGGVAHSAGSDTTFRAGANAVVNSSMGAEYFTSPSFSLLGGLSADISAVPPLGATQAPGLGTFYIERLNRAIVSLGVGSYGDASDLMIGTQLSYGWGKALAVNSYVVPNELVAVDKSTVGVLLVVAGNTSLKAIERTLNRVEDIVRPRPR